MIKDVKIYNILISCASDIKEELDVIYDVVKYYNQTTGYTNFIKLNLMSWMEDSYPLYGADPQEILFEQFINDCDFAIAIFWTKFGSSTANFQSGVQEEIENFYLNSKNVIIFFSDCPISPSKIEIPQLEKVRNYKREIEEKRKGLYYTYENLKDFECKLKYSIYMYMKKEYGCG